jgi:hypothetical protein
MNVKEELVQAMVDTMYKDQKRIEKLEEALQELVCCPAFTGALFEKDKDSHVAWTNARFVLENGDKPS